MANFFTDIATEENFKLFLNKAIKLLIEEREKIEECKEEIEESKKIDIDSNIVFY